jgi:small subunit ribosomal protein S4e
MASTTHLKRHSMPVSWPVKRKNITFTTKPNPGSHKLEYVVPLVVLIRDQLSWASTAKEVKRLVHETEVLVNGKRVKDIKYPVGLFDVVEIKEISKKYVVLFSSVGGKIKLVETKDNLIYLKIIGKKVLPKNKYQLNFMNGFNLVVEKDVFDAVKVNDTIVYDFEKKTISSKLNLKEGNYVYVFDGKFKGRFGKVVSFVEYNGIAKDIVTLEMGGETYSTSKDYCYVVGTSEKDVGRFN